MTAADLGRSRGGRTSKIRLAADRRRRPAAGVVREVIGALRATVGEPPLPGAGHIPELIAARDHLGLTTVKTHVSAILATLDLNNRVQVALLVQEAVLVQEAGLVPPE
ncbi:response regulator transcription factor [Streptomyces zingiberis]|uniref:response regulator transcription factor n=1 Tax=Streptomyces zingiberis TaxID=2053010 RepID=UPI0019D26F8B|nr:response regulator transcription factor [Streptomyces zingiberis]